MRKIFIRDKLMSKPRKLPKPPILDKQHLNSEEVLQTLKRLQYPVEKVIQYVDHAEITNANLLRAALDEVLAKSVKKDCLILLRVNAETRTFADNEALNNHYIALHFSEGKITYLDPTGEAAPLEMQQIITQKFPHLAFASCAAVLQATNPQYEGEVFIMGGNDYDCGALVALGADMLRRNFIEIDQVRLSELSSKRLGQILRKIRKENIDLDKVGGEIGEEIGTILQNSITAAKALTKDLEEVIAEAEKLPKQVAAEPSSSDSSPDVTTSYADHPDKDAKLHPKYDTRKKPKHRLIGMESVFVHEANEYIARKKADIERMRTEKKIGGKGAVERDNQEIMLANEVESQNVAGYVPLVYPNLSKNILKRKKPYLAFAMNLCELLEQSL